jgi:hypothetical protein
MLEGRNARFNYLFTSRIQRIARGMVVRAWYRSAKWALVRLQRWSRDVKLRVEIERRITVKRSKGILPQKYVAPPTKEKKKKKVPPPPRTEEAVDQGPSVSEFEYGEGRMRSHSRDKDYYVPLTKPATIVTRRLLASDKKTDAAAIDDDVYRWLFGVNPPRGTGGVRPGVTVKAPTKPHEEEIAVKKAVVMRAPVIKTAPMATKAPAPLFAKETVRSVAGDVRQDSSGGGGRARKNKQLGTFYKKDASREESDQYKQQFPKQWTQSSLIKFFTKTT